jgi:hypothetical protein
MQQIPFINLFKSALHVSSDKFSHHQEHFWLYMQLLVQCTVTAADRWHGWLCHRSAAVTVHCTKNCIYSLKCSWGWANLSLETCRADLKRSINGICCILLVAYIVFLVIHGHTNIKKNMHAYFRVSVRATFISHQHTTTSYLMTKFLTENCLFSHCVLLNKCAFCSNRYNGMAVSSVWNDHLISPCTDTQYCL